MSDTLAVTLQNNENEANITNEFQGEFRAKSLDPKLLNYALSCDAIHHQDLKISKNLVITCLDQRPCFSLTDLLKSITPSFKSTYASYGPMRQFIKKT